MEEIKALSNKERLILFKMAYDDLKSPSQIQRHIVEQAERELDSVCREEELAITRKALYEIKIKKNE